MAHSHPLALAALERSPLDQLRSAQAVTAEAAPDDTTYLRYLLEAQPSCLLRVARNDVLLACNDAGLHLLGKSTLDEVLNRPFAEHLSREHGKAWEEFVDLVWQTGAGSLECDITTTENSPRTVTLQAVALRDHPDTVESLLISIHDTSPVHNLEEYFQDHERSPETEAKLEEAIAVQAHLIAQLDESRADRQSLMTLLEQGQSEQQRLTRALEGRDAELERTASTHAAEIARLAELSEQLQLALLEKERETRHRIAESERQLADSTGEQARLTVLVEELRAAGDRAQLAVENLNEKVSYLEGELSAATVERTRLTACVEEMRHERRELETARRAADVSRQAAEEQLEGLLIEAQRAATDRQRLEAQYAESAQRAADATREAVARQIEDALTEARQAAERERSQALAEAQADADRRIEQALTESRDAANERQQRAIQQAADAVREAAERRLQDALNEAHETAERRLRQSLADAQQAADERVEQVLRDARAADNERQDPEGMAIDALRTEHAAAVAEWQRVSESLAALNAEFAAAAAARDALQTEREPLMHALEAAERQLETVRAEAAAQRERDRQALAEAQTRHERAELALATACQTRNQGPPERAEAENEQLAAERLDAAGVLGEATRKENAIEKTLADQRVELEGWRNVASELEPLASKGRFAGQLAIALHDLMAKVDARAAFLLRVSQLDVSYRPEIEALRTETMQVLSLARQLSGSPIKSATTQELD